ncbi:site-specific integrase [Vibrio fluvialis]|nr:site-specific integrase [Vibrio fluvialis]
MRYLKIDPSSGIWQFRYKVPAHTRFIFGVTEITSSLRTTSKKVAIVKGLKKEIQIREKIMNFEDSPVTALLEVLQRKVKPYVDSFLDISSIEASGLRERLSDGVYDGLDDNNNSLSHIELSLAIMRDENLYLDEIFPLDKSPQEEATNFLDLVIYEAGMGKFFQHEQAFELHQALVNLNVLRKKLRALIESGDYDEARKLSYKIFGDKRSDDVVIDKQNDLDVSVVNKSSVTAKSKTDIDSVIQGYKLEKDNKGINTRTISATIHACKTVHDLMDITDISKVNRNDANQALMLCKQLPSDPEHEKHRGAFVGLTPRERIQKNKTIKAKIISEHTANRYIERCSTIYRWAKLNKIVDYNPFEGMATRAHKTQKAGTAKAPFNQDDLKHIFQQRNYKKLWQKWIPLIALYTGMRPNEICQLLRVDLKKINDVWCFDLKVTTEKQSLKNLNATRIIPIHSELLKLGIIDFVHDGVSRELFPELSWRKGSGFYRMFENYWNRHIKLESWSNEKKTFYSFRHHFADYYKQRGTPPHLVGAILGHQAGVITYDTYGGEIDVNRLKEVVELFRLEFTL